MPAFEVTKLGISQVFEGRRVFKHLTTEENLIAGAHLQRDAAKVRSGIERVYAYFPVLKNRRAHVSGYLSGGEEDAGDRSCAVGAGGHPPGRTVALNEAGSRNSFRDVKRYKRRKRWLS